MESLKTNNEPSRSFGDRRDIYDGRGRRIGHTEGGGGGGEGVVWPVVLALVVGGIFIADDAESWKGVLGGLGVTGLGVALGVAASKS